ncbi:hypothetical protein GF339_17785, partial [candidate division KSB3 bacterium]|nr:hypothetical protein [candidate division KSB3 bacterium]MBD3326440.1 hypothetical protein [candidate division KSB3 bacterium]
MTQKSCYTQAVLIALGVLLIFIFTGEPLAFAAADWYEYYTEAQAAIKKKDWPTAVKLLEKALEHAPEPEENKKHGFRSVDYYPYLELGLSYLATGDIEAAYRSCEQARVKGVAPREAVGNCLQTTTKFLQNIQQLPTPTPLPAQNIPPRIQLSTEIPPETDQEILPIQGKATDADGIAEIIVSVENRGVTGLMTLETLQREEEAFIVNLPLDVGQSTITIEAVDTLNNRAKQAFITRRPMAVASGPPSPPPVPTSIPSRPSPT